MRWQQWVLIASPAWSLAIQPFGWVPEFRAAMKRVHARPSTLSPRVRAVRQVLRCAWWVTMIYLVVSL